MQPFNILVINAGSSSHKCSLFRLTAPLPETAPPPRWQGNIDWTHPGGAEWRVGDGPGVLLESDDRRAGLGRLLATLWQGEAAVLSGPEEISAVGHRVVHGGERLRTSTLIAAAVKDEIARLADFAPVHNPVALEAIAALEAILPTTPQVAVFDTAFYRELPDAAAIYPGPYAWAERGIRRYGFHGISHRYCAERAAQLLDRPLETLKLITCHLGNGCSLTAIAGGKSIDTTMGFTPLEGLMMGSRSGSIDPGIVIYLLRQAAAEGLDAASAARRIENVLNRESGLLGISGVSSDLRQVMAAIDEGNARAQLAFAIYVQRLAAGIAALIPALGGLDALVFTAGVGEHSAEVREHTCARLAHLNLALDPKKNRSARPDAEISDAGSAVRVLVIHTQEDWAIARECWQLLAPT